MGDELDLDFGNFSKIDPNTGRAYSANLNGLGQYSDQLFGYSDASTGKGSNLVDLDFGFKLNPDGSAVTPPVNKGMGAMGMLNFGLGAAQALAGIHYQNKALDQGQQALNLSKQKYTDLRGDKAALAAANQERNALAQSQINAYKG